MNEGDTDTFEGHVKRHWASLKPKFVNCVLCRAAVELEACTRGVRILIVAMIRQLDHAMASASNESTPMKSMVQTMIKSLDTLHYFTFQSAARAYAARS